MTEPGGLALAYLGDAVFELYIRERLMSSGLAIVSRLHEKAISYTSAPSQASAVDFILPFLDEEETEIYKRGRNTGGTHRPKSASLAEYRKATGFEALIGHLYLLKKEDRLAFLLDKSFEFIKNGKSPDSAVKSS